MIRISTRLAACGTAFLLAAATAPANAAYTGYGNGDPGNWDFWTEQNGGKSTPAMTPNHTPTKRLHHAHHHHHRPANEAKPS